MPIPVPISPETNRIILKPSIYDPALVGNTSLAMMKAVVDLFREVTPLSIVESDNPLRTAEEAFEKTGYTSLIGENVELVNLSKEEQILADFAGNGIAQEKVPELLLKHNFLVNIATLKIQEGIGFGAGIKNLFGLLGRRDKTNFHDDLNNVLLDILIQFRPILSIVDMTEIVVGNRDEGKSKLIGGIIVGTDPVAVDAYCASLIGIDPLKIDYIRKAYESGLGEALPERIQVLGTEHQIRRISDILRSMTSP